MKVFLVKAAIKERLCWLAKVWDLISMKEAAVGWIIESQWDWR